MRLSLELRKLYAHRHTFSYISIAYGRTNSKILRAYKHSYWCILITCRRSISVCRFVQRAPVMQNPSLSKLRVHQVQRAIEPFMPMQGMLKPRGGWLRAIREALGRSVRIQAARIGISPSTLQKSEVSEADDRITLGQLRKLASGLDCELVYALVPRQPLQAMVEERADQLARAEVMSVAHTMALEDQRPSDSFLERKVADRRQELLAGSWSRLWR